MKHRMKQKYLLPLCLFLFSISLCTACAEGDDEPLNNTENNEPAPGEEPGTGNEPTETFPTTEFASIELTEVQKYDGVQDVRVSHAFNYTQEGRLAAYTFRQAMTAGGEEMEIASETGVEYADRQAVITDGEGNTFVYTLDEQGYATACISQSATGDNRRTYALTYENGRLTSLTETLADGTCLSILTITYNEKEHSMNVSQRMGEVQADFLLTAAKQDGPVENLSQLPCLFLTELHPLSLHTAALYGKLLGEPFDWHIMQVKPCTTDMEGNLTAASATGEVIDYSYGYDNNGLLTTCRQTTSLYEDGHSYKTDYKRTISYTFR